MKKSLLAILATVLAVLLIFTWWNQSVKSISKEAAPQNFLILKGSSATQIANKLKKEELIRSSLAFKFYVQLTGRAKKIQAGEYSLKPSENLFLIVEELLKGPQEVWVTIPEGLRREEIAEKFVDGLLKKDKEAEVFRSEFLSLTKNKEGYLFPDTYLFPKTATATNIVNVLESTFDKRIVRYEDDIAGSDLTSNQIVTLASLIERETITNEERPIVAGILIKRAEADWPLQVDATVQYALASAKCRNQTTDCDWWPRPLSKDDIGISSPLNTYKYPGFPPSPISNPGLSSLSAAIFPEESDYWFYLHDSKGEIHYAETIEEHNRNVSKYLGK